MINVLRNKKIAYLLIVCMLVGILNVIIASPVLAAGTVYNVGPGQTYANIGDVPLETIKAGDTVNIYWRSTPYKEKWVINAQGTSSAPITFHGVPDASTGALPVIDGNGATTRTQLNFSSQARGIIKIGASTAPADGQPSYITIENLEIKSGRAPYTFKSYTGATTNYVNNTSGIYIEKGDNITLRNIKITDCGNGLFAACNADYDFWSSKLLVEGCSFYDNGTDNSYYEHNVYTEVQGMTFQYSYFGRERNSTCTGSSLKDRSSGTVIRYSYIDTAARAIDLVDSQEGYTKLGSDPAYHNAFVYGNTIYNGPLGSVNMIHWGGDSGIPAHNRNGTLYFYNNTVINECDQTGTPSRWRTGIFEPTDANNIIDARNNIFFAKSATTGVAVTEISLLSTQSTTSPVGNFGVNYVSPGWIATGTMTGTSNFISPANNNPGFVSVSSKNFQLASGSVCIDAGGALSPAVSAYPVDKEYVNPQSSKTRTANGSAMDLGAYEFITGTTPGPTATPTPTPTPTPTGSTPTPTPTATPTPGGFPITIFNDTQNFTFTGGTGTGAIDNTAGVGGSKCVKFTGVGSYAESVHMDYTASPISLSGVAGTDKFQLSVDVGTTAVSTLYVYLNNYQYYFTITGLNNTVGYQTYSFDMSSVLSGLGGSITTVYFKPDVACTIWADDISIVRPGGATPTPTPTATATPTPTPTPTATATPTPTPGGFPIIIFQDTQNFTFSGGTGTGVIDNTSGVGGSKCVKFVDPTGYAETVHMDYSAAPISISSAVSTDKLQLSVDVGTATVGTLYVYLNNYSNYLTITGLDKVAGYQTYTLSLSGVYSNLAGNITAVYFKPEVACTILADNISIVH